MFSAAKRHTLYQILNAPVRRYPFPHIAAENVFPADFYAELQRRMLPDSCYTPLVETGRVGTAYSPDRLCLFPEGIDAVNTGADNKAFWKSLFAAYNDADFINAWVSVFQTALHDRIATGNLPSYVDPAKPQVASEMFLMRDRTNYALGPHTDAVRKVVSVIFYLPPGDAQPELGTSLYLPKQKGLTHDGGGAHLEFADFDRVATVPYRANTVFAFPKTPACFHGVEPLREAGQKRDLMLFDIKFLQG